MRKNLKVKAMLLVLALIAFLFSTNDFGLVGAEKMGIVSAIGIDKLNDEYLVTTQIATVENADSKSGTQKILFSKGSTIQETLNKIHEGTGWTMNLNFLNLIVLGESIVNNDIYSALEFFIKGESSLPNVTLAATTNANEVLKAETVLDRISAIALHKNLNVTGDKINSITKVTLKDFFINYLSKSKSNFLPFVKIEKQRQSEDIDKDSFFLLSTMVVNENKSVGVLDEKSTRVLNLIENKKALGYYTANNIKINDDYYTLSYKIDRKKVCKKIDISDTGEVTLKLDINLTLDLKDKTRLGFKEKELTFENADTLLKVENEIKQDIKDLFLFSQNTNTDIFKIKDDLQKYHYKKHQKFFENTDFIKNAKLILNVHCKNNKVK